MKAWKCSHSAVMWVDHSVDQKLSSAVLADPAKVLQSGALPKINATVVEAPKRDAPQKPAPVSDPAEDLKRAEARLAAAEAAAARPPKIGVDDVNNLRKMNISTFSIHSTSRPSRSV